MVLRNKTYEHDANEETWQLCFFLRRSCEKNPVDWTRKVAKFRPPHLSVDSQRATTKLMNLDEKYKVSTLC